MSRWLHLQDIASALLSGAMSPQEARLRELPPSVLVHYACDCAMRCLGSQNVLDARLARAIAVRRDAMEGRVGEDVLLRCRGELLQRRDVPLLETSEDAKALRNRIAGEVVLSALAPEPEEAVLLVLRATGSMITDLADETIAWEQAFDREQSWQRGHLAGLLMEFLDAHRRLLFLLSHRAAALQTQLSSFQNDLEDVLY